MPPKKKNQPSEVCCVCCQAITKGKDECLYCGGDCQQWLHRYCAGVPTKVYQSMIEKSSTFFCYACNLKSHRNEIDTLKETVETLKTELSQLKTAQLSAPLRTPAVVEPSLSASPPEPVHKNSSLARPSISTDRKYNIVLYGIDECPNGTPRTTRIEEDFKKVISLLTKANESINSNSIADIHRLGKYSLERRKPRPILAKFIRVVDVTNVLMGRKALQGTSATIKPDMTLTERKCDSILLKHRWTLIQSGVLREDIKIRGQNLLVRNETYGKVTISGTEVTFTQCSSPANTLNHDTPQASITTQSQPQPDLVSSPENTFLVNSHPLPTQGTC